MLSFNLEGFHRNKFYLSKLLDQEDVNLLFIQETWLPYHDQSLLNQYFTGFSFVASSSDMFIPVEDRLLRQGPCWHGVALGWKNDLNSSVCPLESNHERLAGIKLKLSETSILLVSFYAPTSGQDEDFLESISYLSEFLLQNLSHGDMVVIGTDSNCSIKSTLRRQRSWNAFCDTFSLNIHSTSTATFHHHNGSSESMIDFFATSASLSVAKPRQFCTLDNPLNLSSHDPILTTVLVQDKSEKHKSKFSNTYKAFDRQKIQWDDEKMSEYHRLAAQALSGAASYWNAPETIPLQISLYSNLLVKCATMVFEVKTKKSSASERFSGKLKKAERSLSESFKCWKRAGKPPCNSNHKRASYTKARANLQRLRRNAENSKFIRENNFLMHAEKNYRNSVYTKMKRNRVTLSNSTTSLLNTPVGSFHGDDVLEGFAADAEHLGTSNESSQTFDQSFYKLCKLDNFYIFEFKDEVRIPPMSMFQLDHILQSKMKLGKSCDIYQLTVEHLRFCGTEAKLHILDLINKILQDIYYLTCPQIKLGLGVPLHKGKKKPVTKSSSYRRITVTPLVGAIIDYYIDRTAEQIFRPSQNPNQLGFTAGISYLLASIQRGECQRWAVDNKMTCFGVSLYGEAANIVRTNMRTQRCAHQRYLNAH